MPRAAAIYARISADPRGDELGVKRQVQDCRALANRRDWPVADIYVDDDKSAWSGKPRPEYRRLLDDIADGAIDAVLVWHLDRLVRQPRELEDFIDLCARVGIRHIESVSGDLDLMSHDGQLMARILGAVARKESDDKSRRITRKHQELAEAGYPAGGGSRPFGYRSDRRTVEPSEADAVREAVARVRAGDSLRAIATDWNARGIPTVSGKPWSTSVIRRMLMSPRISGQRAYRDAIVAEGRWERIISPEEGAAVRAILGDPARLTRRVVRRYLLSGGLLRCRFCNVVLVARPRGDGSRRYVCARGPGLPGCGKIAVLSEPLEDLITRAVILRLDTPELAEAMDGRTPSADGGAVDHDALLRDQAQLEELAQAFGDRHITLAEYLIARKPIEARIDAARARQSRRNRTSAVRDYVGRSDALRAVWSELPLNRQRAVVAAVLDRAVIGPAVRGRTRFDPERVEPLWRV